MDKLANKYLELLSFMLYIRDENIEIQHFLSTLPCSYHDRIEFEELKTLDDIIRKGK